MRAFICLVALACAASAVSCVERLDDDFLKVYKISERGFRPTEVIKEELNKKQMTPEETVFLCSEQGAIEEELFGEEYGPSSFEYLNSINKYMCTDEELETRHKICHAAAEYDDGSLMFKNLLACCQDLNKHVIDFCADKMNKYDAMSAARVPAIPDYPIFTESRERHESIDTVKAWLSDLGDRNRAEDVARGLSEVDDKEAKIFGDLTVADFLKLNRFNLDQCRPEALHERAQFAQSLKPKVKAGNDFDEQAEIERALLYFSRRTLVHVATYCVRYKDHPLIEQSDEFKSALKTALDQNKVVFDADLAAAVKFDPTPLEKFLLETKPAVVDV